MLGCSRASGACQHAAPFLQPPLFALIALLATTLPISPASPPHTPQIDAHYDKLRNVGEYIEDTEEYINIELDAGRNRLIRLDIVLTAAGFALAPFNLMAGEGGGRGQGEFGFLFSETSSLPME